MNNHKYTTLFYKYFYVFSCLSIRALDKRFVQVKKVNWKTKKKPWKRTGRANWLTWACWQRLARVSLLGWYYYRSSYSIQRVRFRIIYATDILNLRFIFIYFFFFYYCTDTYEYGALCVCSTYVRIESRIDNRHFEKKKRRNRISSINSNFEYKHAVYIF